MVSSGSVSRISWGSFSSIRTMLPGSFALSGGLMVGEPSSFSVMRRSRFAAATATNPSSAECLNPTANGFVLNSFVPVGSKLTPTFMFNVGKASVSASVSSDDRQLWTLTLKRNGPFGDEHVPATYAISPLITIDSSRLGKAPVTLSKTGVT